MKKALVSVIQVSAVSFSFGMGYGLMVVVAEKITDLIDEYKINRELKKKEV